MRRVLVIGGGASGLAAAYRLTRLARFGGTEFRVTLLEAGDRLGGKILTEKVGDLSIEAGPDSFITAKPEALELVRELGLEDRILTTDRERTDVYVYVRGRLRRLPEGLMLMAPARIFPFLRSDLMTWPGKFRMGLDFILPRGPGEDVSLGDFARRRFGREALRTIVQPVMAGIYAGDADQLSLKSTFPRFLELERRHGSVLRGLMASRSDAPPSSDGRKDLTMFITLAGGLSEFVEALASRLEAGTIRLNAGVAGICPRQNGWRATLANGESMDADAAILAVPAWACASMVRGMDSELAGALEAIPFATSATVSLAYDAEQAPSLPPGFGLVVARGESRAVTAATFTSAKFPGRVPPGTTLIRCFLGGAGRESELGQPDAALALAVRMDLQTILGIEAQPRIVRVYRWPRGNPQYTVGHEAKLRRIDACLARRPGLALAGASYCGVGIPDCVASGARAADSLYNLLRTSQEGSA